MKNFLYLPLKIAKNFWGFDPENKNPINYTIVDIKIILYMVSLLRDQKNVTIYTSIKDIKNKLNIQYNSSIVNSLKKLGWKKIENSHLYKIDLSDDWDINSRYIKIPKNLYEKLNNKNIIMWKFMFYILYTLHNNPYIIHKIPIKKIYNKLMITYYRQHNNEYISKFKQCLDILQECNIISNFIIKDNYLYIDIKNNLKIESNNNINTMNNNINNTNNNTNNKRNIKDEFPIISIGSKIPELYNFDFNIELEDFTDNFLEFNEN